MNHRGICTPVFLFTSIEMAYGSKNMWMNKENIICVHNGILLRHKLEWNKIIYTRMHVTRDHAKWNNLVTRLRKSYICFH